MKMHPTLVEKLLKIMEINSGWKEEWKLKQALEALDISVYEQKTSGRTVLVDTDQLKALTKGV